MHRYVVNVCACIGMYLICMHVYIYKYRYNDIHIQIFIYLFIYVISAACGKESLDHSPSEG